MLNLKDFNANNTFDREDQAPRRALSNGIHEYTVNSVEEVVVPSRYSGECSALQMGLLLDGSVSAPHVRLFLNSTPKNQETFRAFLYSLGLVAEDGTCLVGDWEDLVGKSGRAYFVSKKLSRGGTVYDPTEWLPYDAGKMSNYQPF